MPDGAEPEVVRVTIPSKLRFLLEPHPYKVAYGGRFGLKTRTFATALLALGRSKPMRILCGREVMTSIRDSVHQELKSVIENNPAFSTFYDVFDNEIRGKNGTRFIFVGLLGHTVNSIKSYADIDVCWVEEAQNVSRKSWLILIPTIRKPGSEIWVSFNPDLDTDDTWQRWVETPLPGTVSVKTGWQDAAALGWFPPAEDAKRRHSQQHEPDDYDNVWEGMPRATVAGAIYAREVATMIAEGRAGGVPYDPRLPVHTVWDLGWNDAMTVLMVQKPTPSIVNVINYLEDNQHTYAEYVADLGKLNYVWGTDWLPHDGAHRDPKSGQSALQVLQALGRKRVRLIGQDDIEAGIKLARMMFPRVYMDTTDRDRDTGYMGGARLQECLKRYRRNVPRGTGEPAQPVHDQYSHGADCFRYLAMIVDQIRNDADIKRPPVLPVRRSSVRGAGMLG